MPRGRNPYPGASPYEDRHGNVRWRFRRKGCKTVPLPSGGPGDSAFRDACEAAVAGSTPIIIGASRTRPGTFDALIADYYRFSNLKDMAQSTQKDTRRILERFRMEHGTKRVTHLRREDIIRFMERANTPVAANNLLKRLWWLMAFAVDRGDVPVNPTLGVKRRPAKTRPHHTWTDEELDPFRAAHPYGTRARLAFALMLCLAQRGRSDAHRMGRQHIKDGAFHFTATKNKAELMIEIDEELAAAIKAMPGGNLTLLTTKQGKPFTAASFGNWFAEQVKAAGLPKRCVAHGLRKAAGRQLAEDDATEKQIMAFIGDRDPRAAAVYTAAADQKRLAKAASAKRRGAKREQDLANQSDGFANAEAKSLKRKAD